MIVLGVDPGYQTGLAIVDVRRERILRLATVEPNERFALNDILRAMAEDYGAQAAVVQVPMFAEGKTPRWNRSPVSLAKNAQLAGEIAGYLEGIGLEVRREPPRPGRGMKMPRAMFVRAFGVDGSEHARDAAMLALSWNDAGRAGPSRATAPTLSQEPVGKLHTVCLQRSEGRGSSNGR